MENRAKGPSLPDHDKIPVVPLGLAMLMTLFGMFIFEIAKQVLFLNIVSWQSYIMSVSFGSVMATITAYFVLRIRRAEKALQDSEGWYHGLFNSGSDLMFVGRITSKDKFFAILAYDLKNPLIVFLSYAKLLENIEELGQEQFKELTRQFRTSAENLFALLENLLLWSQIQRGMIEPFPQEIPIDVFAVRNIELLTPNAEHKQITLNNLVQEELPVYADVNMIDTVVRNLLSNAIKFTHAGGAVAISATHDENTVTVAVSDTGIGIPQEKLSNLFRIDAKCQRAGTAGEKGTGLGLILCKEFVERHGGNIWVASEIGKGTTVRFTLPTKPHEKCSG
jgi:signal transduction histidine kinase